jgi:hypothetical protein
MMTLFAYIAFLYLETNNSVFQQQSLIILKKNYNSYRLFVEGAITSIALPYGELKQYNTIK